VGLYSSYIGFGAGQLQSYLPLRASPGNAKALGLLKALLGTFKDVKHCLFVHLCKKVVTKLYKSHCHDG
jgi:hypothetical protein